LDDTSITGSDSQIPNLIRETTRSFVSVVVLSSDSSHETASFAFKNGALDFIHKGSNEERLRDELNEKIINCMEERTNLIGNGAPLSSSTQRYAPECNIIDNLRALYRKTRIPSNGSTSATPDSTISTDTILTPIELVVKMISSVVEGNYTCHQQRIILGGILKSLGSSNVYHPQLREDIPPSPWFTSDYLNAIKSNNAHRNSTFSLMSQQSGANDDKQEKDSVQEYVFPPKATDDAHLEKLNTFEFDMFQYSTDRLTKSIVQMFESFDLIEHFNIDVGKLISFVGEVRAKYLPNLYHNWEHAWDVTQFSYACLHDPCIQKVLDSPLDRLCTLVAAIGHDIGHEGVNNNFQKRTQTPLAMLYNDEHCLEHYHASTLFNMILKSRNNIIEHLSEEDYFTFREIVINSILSTDPERHCEILAKFNSSCGAGQLEPTKDNKKQVIAMIVKSADISNVARPFHLAEVWAERVTQEFLSQGDREKGLGLTVNALNDRSKANKSALQMGFIKFFALPLFESMANAFPTFKHVRERVENNHTRWTEVNKREEETGERPRYDQVEHTNGDTQKPRKNLLVIADELNSGDLVPHTDVVAGVSILCVSTQSETHDLCRELLLGYHQFYSENSVEDAKKVIESKQEINMIILEEDQNLDVELLTAATTPKQIPIFMVSDFNTEPAGVTQFAVKPIHVPDFLKHCNVCIQASLDEFLFDDLKAGFESNGEAMKNALKEAEAFVKRTPEAQSNHQWKRIGEEANQLKLVTSNAGIRALAFAAYDLGLTCSNISANHQYQIAAKFLSLKKRLETIQYWAKEQGITM